MNSRYRIILLLASMAIILALMFSACQFNSSNRHAQIMSSIFQLEKPGKPIFFKGEAKPEALLVLGATVLMAGGVLWSILNYKE